MKTLPKKREKREEKIKRNLHQLIALSAVFNFELTKAAKTQKEIEDLMKPIS